MCLSSVLTQALGISKQDLLWKNTFIYQLLKKDFCLLWNTLDYDRGEALNGVLVAFPPFASLLDFHLIKFAH